MNSIKNFLENNQHKFQHSFKFKVRNYILTLYDQEEALKQPCSAYYFTCLNIPETDIEKCQVAACKDRWYAFLFAKNVSGANVKYCQKYACKRPIEAYWFAVDIPGADIEYCRKICESHPFLKNEFDKKFPIKHL